ncbi:SDR family oxidoreductase [Pseudarthrobacter sp. MDT3-9]|nr:SDR family oxidoreductase [Pseudarthrobacter sp. MDT3-9]
MSQTTSTSRVAVVTGAAHGFGRAISVGLAERGVDLVLVDLVDASETASLVEEQGQRALKIQADVTNEGDIARVRKEIEVSFGRCDILINNAGAYPFKDFFELDYEFWRKIQTLNLDSQFLMTKAVVDLMMKNSWGRIVNISSNSIGLAFPGLTHYMASKMGVIGFTRGLASDLGPHGITVNAIGPTATPNGGTFQHGVDDEVAEAASQMQAIKRVGTAQDIVGTIQFLVSEDAEFLTGQTLMVDGGLVRL